MDRTTKTEFDWKQEWVLDEEDENTLEDLMRWAIDWCIKRVPCHWDEEKSRYLYSIEWTTTKRVLIRFGFINPDNDDEFYEDGRFYVFYLEE